MSEDAPTTLIAAETLAEVLKGWQLVSPDDVERWARAAAEEGVLLETILLREKAFTRTQLLQVLENHFFCPSIDLPSSATDPEAIAKVPRKVAEHFLAIPVQVKESQLVVAFADPSNARAIEAVSQAAHLHVAPRVALASDIREAIAHSYGRQTTTASRPAHERGAGAGGARRRAARQAFPPVHVGENVVEAVDAILAGGVERRATDIHVNPREDDVVVRYRVDGILHTAAKLPVKLKPPLISRLKILADLDIAEHRVPQDGRQTIEVNQAHYDLRVSSLPSQFGENIVIRILKKDEGFQSLDKLQMPPAIREAHKDMLTSPLGFFLVTGPTGSGKTTTLYATLSALDREHLNIITLEDPVEYTLPGITQVPIKDDAGLTFASGLRSILRQDPDVVLVGEIRDLETVEIACRAALTGHKVLSTIHTNDACQAVTRLLDMGTAPSLITATLRGVMAQRLVRVICEHCKETYEPNDTEIAVLGYPKEAQLARGVGCEKCASTGYSGRMAIFEYFKLEESLHRFILDRASPYAIRSAAQKNGMILMSEFARKAVLEGRTTVSEIQRVIFSAESKEQLCENCQRVVAIDFSICPFCQHVLKENCQGCGAPLDASWEACPKCGREVEREWKKIYCRRCLAPVDAEWKSCRYCGESL